MKKLLCIVALAFSLQGCAELQQIGDYINDNPMVANVVVRQAVARYIDAGATPEEETGRAERVRNVVSKTETFLDGNPTASVDGILLVIDSQIRWERLAPADRLLVQDIMMLVQTALVKKQQQEELAEDIKLSIRAMLRTALSAAAAF